MNSSPVVGNGGQTASIVDGGPQSYTYRLNDTYTNNAMAWFHFVLTITLSVAMVVTNNKIEDERKCR